MTHESTTTRHSARGDRPTDDRNGAGPPATASPAKAARPPSTKGKWLVPALLLLSAIPVIAGAVRLTELAGGAEITPQNARFVTAPVPVVVHIIGVTLYSVLGAFQFAPGLRRRRPGLHRAAGRLLVPCGLAAALSGLWMTLFYAHPADTGALVTGFRLVFGSIMIVSLVLGFTAIRRRDIARHRAWMIRAYAIAQGAGTQALTQLPWILIVGMPGKLSKGLLMGAAWLINLAIAEWIIRRRPAGPIRTSAGAAVAAGGGVPAAAGSRIGADSHHIA
ncbi:DUF2306 domain-containing protein [Actinomadura scrupuli]|uniref:DUF2306 domain-containing protein n=1 Tax=Actinomadura scrupuli TaxID=559629 RepID=UPI003D99820C